MVDLLEQTETIRKILKKALAMESKLQTSGSHKELINPFVANFPILYLLKPQDNQRFSGVFRENKMGILAKKWVKEEILCT